MTGWYSIWSWVKVSLILLVVACDQGFSSVSTTLECPELQYSSVNCEVCLLSNVSKNNGSLLTKGLHQQFMDGNISFSTENKEVKWQFPPMFESKFTFVTLYYRIDDRFAAPLPGCCAIPMKEKECSFYGSNINLASYNHTYVAFTLFRTRLVESLNLKPIYAKNRIQTAEEDKDQDKQSDELGKRITTVPPTTEKYEVDKDPNLSAPESGQPPYPPYSDDPSYFEPYDYPQIYYTEDYFGNPAVTGVGFPVSTSSVATTILPAPPIISPWEKYLRNEDAKRYSYVCEFQIPKEQALGGKNETTSNSIDHYLFKRGVYDMPGYFYQEDVVFHISRPDLPVNCSSRSFASSPEAVYELQSANTDNSTFTCLVLWLTISSENEVDVKCMPHNATYNTKFPTVKATITNDKENKLLKKTMAPVAIVSISVVGGSVFLLLSIALILKWAQKMNDLITESKKLPATLEATLNDDKHFTKLSNKMDYETPVPLKLGSDQQRKLIIPTVHKFRNINSDEDNIKENNEKVDNQPQGITALSNPVYCTKANIRDCQLTPTSPGGVQEDFQSYQPKSNYIEYELGKQTDDILLTSECDPVSSSYILRVVDGQNDTVISINNESKIGNKQWLPVKETTDIIEETTSPYRDHLTFLPIHDA